jgi:predicted DNA-binding transcriptional regulator AlpA
MNDMPRRSQNSSLLNMREILEMTTFSRQQVYRLMREGAFPESRDIGCRRAVWHATDLLAWMLEKVEARHDGQFIGLSLDDRFVTFKSVTKLTGLSFQSIGRMEEHGAFPQRIRVSSERIVWLEREVLAWIGKRHRRRNDGSAGWGPVAASL